MAIPGDPFSSFFGSVGSGLGKGIGDAIGGGGGPMVSGGTTDARSGMDGSGWTVSTGTSKAVGGARTGGLDNSGLASGPIGQSAGLGLAGPGNLLMLVLLGLAGAYMLKGRL